jgi:hypothetical protein
MRTGSNQPKYLTESQLGQTAGPNVDMVGRFSVQGHRRYCLGIPTTTNKLLMHKDAHSGHSSEGALILQANWSDFDFAIPWFESRRPSQPVLSPSIFVTMLPRRPPLAGFSHQAESLCVPNRVVPRDNTPKISASLRHCSRFLENRAGDLVRLHCVTGMLREIPSILAIVLSVRISLAPPGLF